MGDDPEDLRIDEEQHGTVLTGEKSIHAPSAIYLNMRGKYETVNDGHEMFLTREQAVELCNWLSRQLTT